MHYNQYTYKKKNQTDKKTHAETDPRFSTTKHTQIRAPQKQRTTNRFPYIIRFVFGTLVQSQMIRRKKTNAIKFETRMVHFFRHYWYITLHY